ncbi:hypothetical protein [Streptacidiphilus sp. EB103A]|uniref:hypothetical protein n=1 Tax=Streptacidiphilus sp. EB103A TaxID=3156275 RepID=UPI0035181F71
MHPYHQLDPARRTDAGLSCAVCRGIEAADPAAPRHLGELAREHADAVLARADRRGYPPSLSSDGLRQSLAALYPDRAPDEKLYPLIREHLVTSLTERAMTVPPGTPEVLVEYTRYTGGTLRAPIGPGDRLMHDGVAGGNWSISHVVAVRSTADGVQVTLREDGRPPARWTAPNVTRWFLKLDRGPLAPADHH